MDYDLRALCDLDARVVLFPVRHHSPTAARLVRELARRLRPAAVLIEGPSDFNDRLDELLLPHRPPLAIYSFVRLPGGQRRGAYYPFCDHSPEWQALHAGREVGADVRFIDLPWADVAGAAEEPANRYADAEFRRSGYIAKLCRRLGIEDFDALWDTLVELDAGMTVETYLERCHSLCGHMRLLEGSGSTTNRRREAFMASAICDALARQPGRVLVVTGGYHSVALHGRLTGKAPPGMAEPAECLPTSPTPDVERGIALTPFTFERLDSLTGYEAGMPNPGFYQQVWQDRRAGGRDTHRTLLRRVAERLRQRKQAVSAADLIAAEGTARALAALRGHAEVWRTDLVDGLAASLIKDDRGPGGRHPLLDAVHEVLRGGERGVLAAGTRLPPLVADVQQLLAAHDLQPQGRSREIELDLDTPADRPRSRVLHQVRLLGLDGFERIGGTDLAARDDLSRVWERWRVAWGPDFDARCIECARYGPTLAEAAAARLGEQAQAIDRDANQAALLLLDAALAGLTALAGTLRQRLLELVRGDGEFLGVAGALGHLLYLYRYDAALETAGRGEIGELLREAFVRGLWLLESLGQTGGQDAQVLEGVRALRDAFERCEAALGLDRAETLQVLARVGSDRHQSPAVRGAALGAAWSLGGADGEQVRAELRRFADPNQLGDFLSGLFALAREQVQRQRDLVLAIHALLSGYGDEDFLTALPALRLAFTYFTPREKHHLALTLREALGLEDEPEMAALTVSVDEAARALALEAKLFAALEKYGLRGRDDE
ncbi:MAG TPA: DUF5682 family protein [Gemmataceae bacterium]|nr:DUF5682 family protein [Gemmataceae bacterium]